MAALEPPTNFQRPTSLLERILVSRIRQCPYFAINCFGLNLEILVDRGCELQYAGFQYSRLAKPTPFACLLYKLLELEPSHEILNEFLQQKDFKYLRCLAATYARLSLSPVDVHLTLEPLLSDYRSIIVRTVSGWSKTTVDSFIQTLLCERVILGLSLPSKPARSMLVRINYLLPYVGHVSKEELGTFQNATREKMKQKQNISETTTKPDLREAPIADLFQYINDVTLGHRPTKPRYASMSRRGWEIFGNNLVRSQFGMKPLDVGDEGMKEQRRIAISVIEDLD